jgi:hypothetical protein
MADRGGMSLDADSRVRDNPERQTTVAWPLPVDVRLDRLLDQATEAGERTSRRELLAALVATCDLTDAELSEMLRRYRTATVRQILPIPDGENVLPFTKQPPGPRTGRRSPNR